MNEGAGYIKAYALSLMADGITAEDALAEATRRWSIRQKNEQTLDALMKGDKS